MLNCEQEASLNHQYKQMQLADKEGMRWLMLAAQQRESQEVRSANLFKRMLRSLLRLRSAKVRVMLEYPTELSTVRQTKAVG